MLRMKTKAVVSFFLVTVLLTACFSGTASAEKTVGYAWQVGFNNYTPVWCKSFRNPAFVSGAGTIITVYVSTEKDGSKSAADGQTERKCVYYNLIENDYHKAHKDELLEKAYLEFEEQYETWRDQEIVNDGPDAYPERAVAYTKLYSSDGVFKAWAEDYGNPEKTVYLELMLTDAAAAAEITADEAVTLIYDTDRCPCIVVRFTGNEAVFKTIIDNPNVRYAAPAFGVSASPNGVYRFIRSPYHKTGVTADSARNILRYAVGLDVTEDLEPDSDGYVVNEKEFFIFSDFDFDGHITAADARTALRIAVGLEEEPVVAG